MFSIFRKTATEVAESSLKALNMDGLRGWQKEMPMASFTSAKDLDAWAIGCDKDIGGFSEAHLDFNDGHGRFHGHLSLDLPAENKEIKQSGYAAIRTKVKPQTLFGVPCWDTTLFRYLALHVKGDNRKYFVNIQTDGVVKTDLFQHRLFLRTPGQWETVMIPFRDFILTNNGIVQEDQIEMYREKVKTIGISIMDRQEGPFSLEIDWIKAMNTEFTEGDMDRLPPSAAAEE
ncbi:complex I intermediate-associated protein 30-domain-containing protein [Cokeromyces recurvatus]|uniref:complex I intermediate-associated protein 30-domain-containing protein n=1 Tax=Cokeromyces recurvatus TaxID=90255 RepID=UPI00221E4A7A|nr:complex I intermediate-associated protein 30-domain-containing protein [Cokeromyces recurvatus]KAI7900876.1 complex I intermediate-associated protein 30-domain-containing protein [Cokeromyces recurvatus]